ncbi:MAG: nicotinate-nicotinamide nucleotide adenylyltransferase [Oscillospiraceae bacterium]|jgi:nicotinate-nucleotide adenylyltransferase|nr:nicotinate-nicotinamide nucleotide adenylyltransferase [Oscillospiraceae bacterium]
MILGLYGGSFNPPHNGHVALARKALDELRLDRLIWMPSGSPPHRELPDNTPSAAHRLAMSKLAAGRLRDTEVSSFELYGGAQYTYDTVKTLLEREKPETLWLLMGSDMGDTFDMWVRADELRALCKTYVCPRTALPVSSTEIRGLLARGLGGDMLPAEVYDYIQKEGLYGCPRP